MRIIRLHVTYVTLAAMTAFITCECHLHAGLCKCLRKLECLMEAGATSDPYKRLVWLERLWSAGIYISIYVYIFIYSHIFIHSTFTITFYTYNFIDVLHFHVIYICI